jgi:uncharacterized membrane protein YcaP (DUF421 family)
VRAPRQARNAFARIQADTLVGMAFSNLIVKDGRVDREAMLNTHMSEGDLDEDLRKKGLRNAAKIAEARLEWDGTLSVLKVPTRGSSHQRSSRGRCIEFLDRGNI